MGLDTVELIMAFEKEFGITIPDEVAPELNTPRKMADYIAGEARERGLSREQVAIRVRRVIEEETAIHDFSDDDDFVRDMNLD